MRIRASPSLFTSPRPGKLQFLLQLKPQPQSRNSHSSSSIPPKPYDSRYLSQTKERIGKCMNFGLGPEQIPQAAKVLKILGEEWRELTAGYEGFLTGKKHAGLRRQKVVWGEMDCMNHVNNVTYTRYAESARINWVLNYALHHDPTHRAEWSTLWTPSGLGLILRSIRTNYKFPLRWPDHVSVFHKLAYRPAEGKTAFGLDVIIMSELHQRVSARCVEDIVIYDYVGGRKEVIPDWVRSAFDTTWEAQAKERKRVWKRRVEVANVVRKLELGTWDRENAIEDTGSAVSGASESGLPIEDTGSVDPEASESGLLPEASDVARS